MKVKHILSALGSLLVLSAGGPSHLSAGEPGRDAPNILFVAIDDFNDWGPTQLDGEPFDVDTPNFDALAERGVLFTNAHCNAPVCNSSRASIMSGLHPISTGVYGNGHDWRANERFDDILLLPEYFKKYGYATLGGGKIYHANQGMISIARDFSRPGVGMISFRPLISNCRFRACRISNLTVGKEISIGEEPVNRSRIWGTTRS
jgi:hypothetical protein